MEWCGWHHSNGEVALLAAGGATRRFECAIVLCDHRARAIKQYTAGLGELDATRLAAKELNLEFGFDCPDSLAQGRLLHAKPISGPRDVPFFGNGYKLTEVSKLDCHIVSNMYFV
jgi:hypothetical protein